MALTDPTHQELSSGEESSRMGAAGAVGTVGAVWRPVSRIGAGI